VPITLLAAGQKSQQRRRVDSVQPAAVPVQRAVQVQGRATSVAIKPSQLQ